MTSSEYRILNLSEYPRSEHFRYFCSLAYPYTGLTAEVDITSFLRHCRENAHPFFLSFLWQVSHAANAVPAFRQRIFQEGIIEYRRCPTSHTVLRADGTYCYCRLDAGKPFAEFLPYAKAEQARALSGGIQEGADEALPLLYISTLPWISYTSLVQPVPYPADSNPRITWGKWHKEGDTVMMPVSVLCHHGLIDGRQIADFYQELDQSLRS